MTRIETTLPIHAPLEVIYQAISHAENIPLYAPGIQEASSRSPVEHLTESFLDLVTSSGRHLNGEVLVAEENRAFAIRDENGTIASWDLTPDADGTVASYALEGDFTDEQIPMLRSEMRAKLARLVLDLER